MIFLENLANTQFPRIPVFNTDPPFYAGARSLLVSHWPVETNSAVELTTGIFDEMKKNPEIGRAEALRRSRIRLINNQAHPEYAHPYFWAPFVVVGEGGRMQTPD